VLKPVGYIEVVFFLTPVILKFKFPPKDIFSISMKENNLKNKQTKAANMDATG